MYSQSDTVIIADDDDDDSLFLFQALLSLQRELTIITVPNGQQLVNILESVSPGFIFLDINMPKKNGFEALKHIRSIKGVNYPTVIMCSTSTSTSQIKLSKELGADMYITKPSDLEGLNKIVDNIFKTDWTDKAVERFPGTILFRPNRNMLKAN